MAQQDLFDLCATLFDGVFVGFKEMGLSAEQARGASENFVELFPIMRRLVDSNLTYVTHIRKHPENQALIRWTGSAFLVAIVEHPELSTLEIVMRGAHIKVYRYMVEHCGESKREKRLFEGNAKKYKHLVHRPIPESSSIQDRFELYDILGYRPGRDAVAHLFEIKYYDYLIRLMKEDNPMLFDVMHYTLNGNFERWFEFMTIYKNDFDFRAFFRKYDMEHSLEDYERVIKCATELFGREFTRAKIIHNLTCPAIEFDRAYAFLNIPNPNSRKFEKLKELLDIDVTQLQLWRQD